MIKTIQSNNMHTREIPINPSKRKHRSKAREIVLVILFLILMGIMGLILAAGMLSGRNRLSAAQAFARQTQTAISGDPAPTPFQPSGEVAGVDDPDSSSNPNAPDAIPNRIKPTPTYKKYQKPEGQFNILLLGSDVRPNEGGFRTDIIIWVSLNPKGEFVSAISFPRDLFVQIPGRGENRINVAFPSGGFELLADTFEVNFGVRPDGYVLVDFNGFITLINNLGGIDVQAAQNLTDSCATWIESDGMCSVGPGSVHMNGDLALWYARSRYSSNDIDRARRSQEVVEAIFRRLMSLDVILKVPELYDVYKTYVQTDIGLSDIVPLIPLASKIYENSDIRNHVIGYDLAYDWITIQGAQVLVPDIQGIHELMIEALEME